MTRSLFPGFPTAHSSLSFLPAVVGCLFSSFESSLKAFFPTDADLNHGAVVFHSEVSPLSRNLLPTVFDYNSVTILIPTSML